MKTKEQIIQWLQNNGLYCVFARNLRILRCKEVDSYIKEHTQTPDLIKCAFHWNSTKEGVRFWNRHSKSFTAWFNEK